MLAHSGPIGHHLTVGDGIEHSTAFSKGPTSALNAHKETYQGENEFLWYPIF